MINRDNYVHEKKAEHNEKWPYIPDEWYTVIRIGSSGSRKTNALINLINEENDIGKIYLFA